MYPKTPEQFDTLEWHSSYPRGLLWGNLVEDEGQQAEVRGHSPTKCIRQWARRELEWGLIELWHCCFSWHAYKNCGRD